ncbi:AMIN domain-containing protein [Helicobacter apodemus]|uniref:AMIN domain-containing protein n=1 Tax=Helicobacter apodemus TaxID=135569 RepID=A0A2U8FB72_9HELI|nr:AMIN domain-containing protein [Helicobacter apodemus]AWI33396.1 AMIN domain-containing protein [Helicobacter apodemus]
MKRIILLFALTSLLANEAQKLPDIPTLNIDSDRTPTIDTTNNTGNTQTSQPLRNPFDALVTPKSSGQLLNLPDLNLFTKTEITLPSTARKIKKITIDYQNLDGSITTFEKVLDGNIDWHLPLILAQEIQLPNTQTVAKSNFTLGDSFSFDINKQKVVLKTSFTLIRNFTLTSPTRLILDFKSIANKPLTESLTTNLPVITEVTLETHLDFYRITLSLDGQYNYSIKSDKEEALEIDLY